MTAAEQIIARVEAHPVRNTQTHAVTGYMLTADEWRAIRADLRRAAANSKAEALREAADAGPRSTPTDELWCLWLRDRADAIGATR